MEIRDTYLGLDIVIKLKSFGVYSFENDGGLGKTRLFNILRNLKFDNVLILTYEEGIQSKDVIDKIKDFSGLICLDRYDLYNSSELLKFLSACEDKFILLDYKQSSRLRNIKSVLLDMTEDGIYCYG